MLRWVCALGMAPLLVGCAAIAVPTPTPTRVLSGPTLAPTGDVIPLPPSEVPGSFLDDTAGASDPTAAALPNDLDLPPLAVTQADGTQAVTLTLASTQLTGSLYTNVAVRSPGVLLLSTEADVWGDFPRTIEANGYVVLSVVLPQNADASLVGEVLGSFSELAQGDASLLDPARIAVIGERSAADLTLRACAVDLRCDALGMLSPVDGSGAVLLMGQIGTRPVLLAASQDDSASYTLAQTIATAAGESGLFQPFVSEGAGAALVQNRPDFAELIVTWLNRSLR